MTQIKAVADMLECPCGIVTDQAIVWDYGSKEYIHPLCRTCQKEIMTSITYNTIKPLLKNHNIIECPHCKHGQQHELDEMVEVGDMEGSFEHECEKCEKQFTVQFEYKPYNRTTPLP